MQTLQQNFEFSFTGGRLPPSGSTVAFDAQLKEFNEFGKRTQCFETEVLSPGGERFVVPTFVNEFWTAKQRAAHSLHEISYRACFKPQLPRFFIERLTSEGEGVFDPFMGRGTTLLEAALLGRVPLGCDVNPLSVVLTKPRLNPPRLGEITSRLQLIDYGAAKEFPEELLVFYHPDTLRQICALKRYLLERQRSGQADEIDEWIRMVAVNRLTGHSPGFFSVYTLPPNQAVSVKSQLKINEKRKQKPVQKSVADIIARKSSQLLSDRGHASPRPLRTVHSQCRLITQSSDNVPQIPSESISLVVTSPPFLNVVDYATDNWLRCWFIGVDPATVKLTVTASLGKWQEAMTRVLAELRRMLIPGGHVAFEVGEVRSGKVRLEDSVVLCGSQAGLRPLLILINDQKFTKTANCWGVSNNLKGTNTNRIVVFRKD
jgi:hypothetical protein